jgi:hypothetical protein
LPPSSPVQIERVIRYRAKRATKKYRKGQQVSQVYASRYPKLVKREQWQVFRQQQVLWDPVTRTQSLGKWKVTQQVKLTQLEKIMTVRTFSNKSVTETFARQRVYQKLWENDRGNIRITVNGHVKGQRVREVIHLGFLKMLWKNKHNGYEHFKRFLVGSVLSNLKRRGLRLSDPQQSAQRIADLRTRLATEAKNLERLPDWLRGAQANRLNAIARDIRRQKGSKQLTGATIRIEKLV